MENVAWVTVAVLIFSAYTTNGRNRRQERHRVSNILLIVGCLWGALAVILVAVVVLMAGAVLTAWTYAMSS